MLQVTFDFFLVLLEHALVADGMTFVLLVIKNGAIMADQHIAWSLAIDRKRLLMLEALQNGHFLEWLQLDGICDHIIHADNGMVGKHLL